MLRPPGPSTSPTWASATWAPARVTRRCWGGTRSTSTSTTTARRGRCRRRRRLRLDRTRVRRPPVQRRHLPRLRRPRHGRRRLLVGPEPRRRRAATSCPPTRSSTTAASPTSSRAAATGSSTSPASSWAPARATSPAAASPPASKAAPSRRPASTGRRTPATEEVWTFEDNVAHNNRHSGIYFWQNGVPRTIVDRFTAYHCGQGIFAGSYANLVSYRDCTIYACEKAASSSRRCRPGRAGATARRSRTRACTSTRPA